MAACGSLQPIFDSALPDNPSILESLSSWKDLHHHHHRRQIMPCHGNDDSGEHNPVDCQASSFTEIFGELHFKERDPEPSSLLPPPSTMELETNSDGDGEENAKSPSSMSSQGGGGGHGHHRSSESFSSMNSESLQLCTEGLGFESFGDVEDYKLAEAWQGKEEKESAATCTARRNFYSSSSSFKHRPQYYPHNHHHHHLHEFRRSRSIGSAFRGFPPPISSLSMSGKPWVCFKSYRNDGRFVLKEIRFPTQEFLHASREGGRLTLQFVHPSDEIEEDEGILEDDSDEEDDEDGKREGGGRSENGHGGNVEHG
ncbi:uncharacterized protein LOC115734500 [Rhodamnia argentea]|uniref:Uncharacterized protein LOC115734500 n=1 Tax=Rhodamnia argentea TaxID=178133 RepID=A0A8B8NG64_9MYRT|nr:uncharacterized protein LOC115734500 [Rhodamnia argentea]